MTNQDFQRIYNEALAAGKAAATAMTPAPMAVQAATGLFDEFDFSRPYEVVSDGVCGFAWVNIRQASKAGRKDSPFVKWLRERARGERFSEYGYFEDYTKCWQIWVGGYGQSMQRKSAHAEAMAASFRAAGIRAFAGERMD